MLQLSYVFRDGKWVSQGEHNCANIDLQEKDLLVWTPYSSGARIVLVTDTDMNRLFDLPAVNGAIKMACDWAEAMTKPPATWEDYLDQSISHGTLIEKDLLCALLDLAMEVEPEIYDEFANEMEGIVIKDDDHYLEEASEIFCQLQDRLDLACPDTHYVGFHPGDGSDLGVWSLELW